MQDQYRRGVALGLTMAEVMILLIFGLLLLLAYTELSQPTDDESTQNTLNEIRELRKKYRELSEDWDVLEDKYIEEQQRAERLGQRAERLEQQVEALSEDLNAANKLNDELSQIIENLEKLLERLNEYEDNEVIGQNDGNEHPYCWPREEEGELEYYYSFDVTLTDSGYEIERRPTPKEHSNEKVIELHKRIADGVVNLAPQEFRRVTKGLHDWSTAQTPECRFIVFVRDNTGQYKNTYKERLDMLESRFYKYIDK